VALRSWRAAAAVVRPPPRAEARFEGAAGVCQAVHRVVCTSHVCTPGRPSAHHVTQGWRGTASAVQVWRRFGGERGARCAARSCPPLLCPCAMAVSTLATQHTRARNGVPSVASQDARQGARGPSSGRCTNPHSNEQIGRGTYVASGSAARPGAVRSPAQTVVCAAAPSAGLRSL
jgi:hypothetical protein